jgi:hypothetical protein
MVATVVVALEESELPYMLAGSFATFVYGLPRSTKDVDFVVELVQPSFDKLAGLLQPVFHLDPQQHLETITWTRRYVLTSRTSSFKVELFIKDEDPHHVEQWSRKRRAWSSHAGREVWMPSAEDVVIQKVRWGRPQDRIDAEQVIAVQNRNLDWPYIEKWCDAHGTRKVLEEIRALIPPI